MDRPRVSPLHFERGFAYGWALRPGSSRVEVQLWMDGRLLATEYTGQLLPHACHASCGTPPARRSGFAFALPASARDGFAHDMHVALPVGDGECLHGEVHRYEHSTVRGEVMQQGRQFVGTVWFARRPPRAAVLDVHTAAGALLRRERLAVSRTADANGYCAQFAIRCEELPQHVHFSCRGQPLRGSPCARQPSVVGIVEEADRHGIRGWAFDSAEIGRPLELCLRVDGRAVSWFRPNVRRPEIEARLGQSSAGVIGFALPLPEGIEDGRAHLLEIVCAASGHPLRNGACSVRFEPPWIEHRPGTPAPARPPSRARAPRQALRPRPAVSVVVLNRNGEAVLAEFLRSWSRHNTAATELVVVDHASTDGSLRLLDEWRQRLDMRVLALDRNDSFSASCNLGARHARGEHLLFVNNDIVWLQDALPRMLETLHQGEVGIVGLKLLKSVAESGYAAHSVSDVQHLGVRFRLDEVGYWPYEATASSVRDESEHSPQVVPAVTGAVMLCRKSDFERVGGFRTDYFYGFEDVEFCLRLSQRLGKTVVSRNDLCALHRHGHTRLSGRQVAVTERLQQNRSVLERHVGLWLKQAYWRSLLQGDGYMTRDTLTIGVVVDAAPPGRRTTATARDAATLARDLARVMPHARVVFLPADRDWKNAAGLHVLVVGTPEYDVRSIRHARADLLTVAWVRSDVDRWLQTAWWLEFDFHVAASGEPANGPCGLLARSTTERPLGPALDAARWRLRVAIHVPLAESEVSRRPDVGDRAQALLRELKAAGLPCWLVPRERWDEAGRMADVRVLLDDGDADHGWTARPDALNVRWLCGRRAQRPKRAAGPHARVTREAPSAAWLQQQMEESVGRTFHPS